MLETILICIVTTFLMNTLFLLYIRNKLKKNIDKIKNVVDEIHDEGFANDEEFLTLFDKKLKKLSK